MMLTVGSLFSGIGGFDLGLERAGMSVKWQCEKDPWARKILAKHWPGVPCYEDITTLQPEAVEYVDVLAGGFPCQDLSVAGKRAGLREGTRSGLWLEFARLIRGIRPKYVLVENVPGLLANHALGRVLGDLAECGYDAEWQVLSAAKFGAPHLRKRVWVVAYAQSERSEGRCQRQRRIREKGDNLFESSCSGQTVADAKSEQAGGVFFGRVSSDIGASGDEGREATIWTVEPDVGRVAHGIPRRVDQLRGLGNAVVPQIVEWIGRRINATCFF